MADQRSVYWDANAFLHYVNGRAEYLPVLEALLSNSAVTIYTSVMSIVEVSFGGVEQTRRRLDPAVEGRINDLWANSDTIVVDCQNEIAEGARRLMRETFPRGWRLKPPDAIHLATAQWLIDTGVRIDEFHTYDADLYKYSGVVGFTICAPNTAQLNLFP